MDNFCAVLMKRIIWLQTILYDVLCLLGSTEKNIWNRWSLNYAKTELIKGGVLLFIFIAFKNCEGASSQKWNDLEPGYFFFFLKFEVLSFYISP